MKIRKIAILLVGVCLSLVVAGFPAVVNASPATVNVSDGFIATLGSTTTVSITLDEAPNGLSGYNMTVSLSEPSITEITAVQFPSWASMNDNSTLPADSFWMKAVDLDHQVESGATNIDLGTLTIRGDAQGECQISITVDAMDDDNGTPISPPVSPGTITVGPLPTVAFSAAPYSVGEGDGSATITVNLSAASAQTVTVHYATSDGTATAGSDYTAASGTLTFSPGDTSKTFSVSILEDALVEGDEIVNLSLTNPTNAILGTPSTAVLTIVDNEAPLPPTGVGGTAYPPNKLVILAPWIALAAAIIAAAAIFLRRRRAQS